MATEKQLNANRRNASKSTGPRTNEGKRRSARNALKHGMTAKQTLLADESPRDLERTLDDWSQEFPGAGPIERALIEEAVSAQYQLRRARRNEASEANKRMREIRIDELAAENARVQELGRRLRFDPINRCAFFRKDERSLDAIAAWLEDDPPVIVRELEKTRTGVVWLQNQWKELGATLEREGYWHYNEKFFAIRLLGRRQIEVYEQFGLAMIFAACNVAHIEGWDLVHDSIQANLGVVSHPLYYQRVDSLRRFFPPTKEAAVAVLRRVVDDELNRLDALRAVVDPLHAADDADAAQRAILDHSPEAAHTLRYMTAARNVLFKATGQLLKTYPGQRTSELPAAETDDATDLPWNELPAPTPTPPSPVPPARSTLLDDFRDEGMARWRLDPTPYHKIQPRRDLAERREDMDPSDPRYYARWRPEAEESEVASQQYLPPGGAILRNEPNPPTQQGPHFRVPPSI